MNYVGRFIGNLKGFYSGINGATLTGAIDVVVVEQEDGSFKCSPFHVRFGKLGVLRSKEKVVDIEINGESAPIRMKLGDSGEAFFVQEVDDDEDEDMFLATSPLPASPQLSDSDQRARIGDESDELNVEVNEKTIEPLMLTIENENDDEPSGASVMEQSKNEDLKGRKRKRRRRRNQGSKSNIVVEPLSDGDLEAMDTSETMFKMDEELSPLSSEAQEQSGHTINISQSRSYHRDFYSDTEVDATGTPTNSRPSTPVQSDSEYEISKAHIQKADEVEDVGKWPWGELPSTGGNTPAVTPMVQGDGRAQKSNGKSKEDDLIVSSDDESQSADKSGNQSLLGRMFPFMSKRHSSGNAPNNSDSPAGVYLDDLNVEKMDPEMAALYFPKFDREARDTSKRDQDDDAESGKGSSLPQSPDPGSSPRSSTLSSYMENEKHDLENSLERRFEAISICGGSTALFEQSQLTYDELCENPEVVLQAPPDSIYVKMDGKIVPWSVALPQLLSTTFFKRPLPSQLKERLVSHFLKTEDTASQFDNTSDNLEPVAITRSNTVATSSGKDGSKRYSSWFPWRRSQNSPSMDLEAASEQLTYYQQQQSGVTKPMGLSSENTGEVSSISGTKPWRQSISPPSSPGNMKTATSSSDESEHGTKDLRFRGSVKNVSPSRRPGSLPVSSSIAIGGGSEKEKYKKSLRLTSEQIAQLKLRYGQNEAVFSVTTAYQGTTVARCHIYLWRYDDRVVVSDIDGTITKSDVLGHILPIIGNDWAQSGVAQLFTQIQQNGYKMLYLSARAIGQAQITREYLRSIKQGDVTLPDGPLLLNPTSLMSALHREVIEKKPEEFKIACLRDIQTLFPTNPFYAGYGNKINDVFAYRAVEIAVPRIFTINHKGELRHALTNTFQSSYTSLVELAEFIFPAYKVPHLVDEEGVSKCNCTMTDGYSYFEFWRSPIIELPEDTVVQEVAKSA